MADETQEDRGRDRVLRGARQLFAASGFHQAPMSELASVARVSVGQIYRLFASKSDIIAAIVEKDFNLRLAELESACADVEKGTAPIEEAFHDILLRTLSEGKDALSFEILAEAYRNPKVARLISDLCEQYRATLRRLACVANPDLTEERIEAAEELLLACLFGLGHRTLSRPSLSAEATATRVSEMVLAALR